MKNIVENMVFFFHPNTIGVILKKYIGSCMLYNGMGVNGTLD